MNAKELNRAVSLAQWCGALASDAGRGFFLAAKGKAEME